MMTTALDVPNIAVGWAKLTSSVHIADRKLPALSKVIYVAPQLLQNKGMDAEANHGLPYDYQTCIANALQI